MNLRWLKSRTRRPIRNTNSQRKLRFISLEDRINPAPMLPDLHVLPSYLSGWTIGTTTGGGREIRYSTAMANGGLGAFDLRGTGTIVTNPDGSQDQLVNQRVYQSDGTFIDQPAGYFTYHPNHGHIHFENMAWGQLRIRTSTGDGLGDVVAIGPKTSFCLIDINHYSTTLPGTPASSVYTSCGSQNQGISVGWNDVYGSSLEGQQIDVTGLPNGNYWLEVVTDPMNHIEETNEANNITRIPITITTLPASGFRIQTSSPVGASNVAVSSVTLTFNTAVNASTFNSADDITFNGPNGPIAITGVTAVTSTTYRVDFATQTSVGTYTMNIGPNIANSTGGLMDQNNNGTGGEAADNYTNIFTIPAPRVSSTTPSGSTTAPVSSVRVTYSKPIQSSTFTIDDIVSFTGPGGANLMSSITSVAAVTSGGTSTLFDINFAAQSTGGVYTMILGHNVVDTLGNAVDQNGDGANNASDQFTTTFNITVAGAIGPDGYGYNAVAGTYVNYTIVGLSGTVAIHNSADDASLPFNLGTNRFTFYGTQYTGSNQLYVSTNGIVTFGGAYDEYDNDNLSESTLAAIAPLWDDWVKGPGTPQVVGRMEDTNADGTMDRLVIEWNNVWHYQSTPSGGTFQLILQLNTGNTPGTITFMYKDLDFGNTAYNNGVAATVGMRAAGSSGTKLIASFNASNALIGSGKALRIAVPTVASIAPVVKEPTAAGEDFVSIVTFSHGVTGVDAADFALTMTGGHTGATIDHIHATANPAVYEIHVKTGIGAGTVRLDLTDNNTIFSTAGAPLGGTGAGNGGFIKGYVMNVFQPPPKVQGINIGDGTSQRSMVNQIQVVFDRVVSFAGNNPVDAFALTLGTHSVILAVDLSLSTPEQTVAKLTFSGKLAEFGFLDDGVYNLTVRSDKISTGGVALDGDNNGAAGGNATFLVHSLFGDSDGDRDVDRADSNAFTAAFGLNSGQSGYRYYFDINLDGIVNAIDQGAFKLRLGTSI